MTNFEAWAAEVMVEFADRMAATDIPSWVKNRQIAAVNSVFNSAVATVEMYSSLEQLDTQ